MTVGLDEMAAEGRRRMLKRLDSELIAVHDLAKAARKTWKEDAVTLLDEWVKWSEAKVAAYRQRDEESFKEAGEKAEALATQIRQKIPRAR